MKREDDSDLAAGGVVVFVGHHSFRLFLPVAPRSVSERTTEFCGEYDVVVAASPPEVAVRLVTWCRPTATPDGRAGTARLGHRVSQRGASQRVDERLLTTSCNSNTRRIQQPKTGKPG